MAAHPPLPALAFDLSFSSGPEAAAACGGFIAGLVQKLLGGGGACLWVSYTRRIYPPALKLFGVDTDRVIFSSRYIARNKN